MVGLAKDGLGRAGHSRLVPWHPLRPPPEGVADGSNGYSDDSDSHYSAHEHARANPHADRRPLSDARANGDSHPYVHANSYADTNPHSHIHAVTLGHTRASADAGRRDAHPSRAYSDVPLHFRPSL